jgi:hypothetical protein
MLAPERYTANETGDAMTQRGMLISVLIVVRNDKLRIGVWLEELSLQLAQIVDDYEIIVLDNASNDGTLLELERLTSAGGLPNIQCYALTKQVDYDTACWAGISSSLGDFVAVIQPSALASQVLAELVRVAMTGAEVVLAINTSPLPEGLLYRFCQRCFTAICKSLIGVDLMNDAPRTRLISRRVINYLQQFNVPTVMYRALPATAGFTKARIHYEHSEQVPDDRSLFCAFERGVQFLITYTSAPIRIANMCSLFGAVANIVYSGYVIIVALSFASVAPGWITISLQQSGMFFLISVVLFFLGEYVLNIQSASAGSPRWHVGREFMSVTISRKTRLNVRDEFPAYSPVPKAQYANDM